MNLRFALLSLSLILLLTATHLSAQIPIPLIGKPAKHPKNSFGFVYGFGYTQMQLNDLNSRLEDLQIGKLDPELFNAQLGLNIELYNGLIGYFEGSWGTSLENEVFNKNTSLDFYTSSFEAGACIPVIYTNRVGIWLSGGFRNTSLNLTYNHNTTVSANFNNLLTNPTANANAVNLNSSLNQLGSFGTRFQYRFGSKDKVRPLECRLGFDSDYNYAYRQNPWRESRSRVVVNNMPTISPDNFSFNLIFAVLLTSDFFKPKPSDYNRSLLRNTQ